jgi:hypothetical protein
MQVLAHLEVVGESELSNTVKQHVLVRKECAGPGAAKGQARISGAEGFWSVPILRPNDSVAVNVDVEIEGEIS